MLRVISFTKTSPVSDGRSVPPPPDCKLVEHLTVAERQVRARARVFLDARLQGIRIRQMDKRDC